MRDKLIDILMSKPYGQSSYEEFADYLLANGVIVPPCKLGQTVYWLDDGKIKQGEVFEISLHSDGLLVHTGTQYCLERVFLTREEAEKALAERSENEPKR